MAKLTREEALALTRGEKPKGYQFIDQPPMCTPQNTAAGTKIHEQMEAYIKGPQHTPTPWSVQNHNEIVADDGHESLVADVFDETDNWMANARFIVKAVNNHERLVRRAKKDVAAIKQLCSMVTNYAQQLGLGKKVNVEDWIETEKVLAEIEGE